MSNLLISFNENNADFIKSAFLAVLTLLILTVALFFLFPDKLFWAVCLGLTIWLVVWLFLKWNRNKTVKITGSEAKSVGINGEIYPENKILDIAEFMNFSDAKNVYKVMNYKGRMATEKKNEVSSDAVVASGKKPKNDEGKKQNRVTSSKNISFNPNKIKVSTERGAK